MALSHAEQQKAKAVSAVYTKIINQIKENEKSPTLLGVLYRIPTKTLNVIINFG